MNLRNPSPSSHPCPDPVAQVNSPWRQPPPRAPSFNLNALIREIQTIKLEMKAEIKAEIKAMTMEIVRIQCRPCWTFKRTPIAKNQAMNDRTTKDRMTNDWRATEWTTINLMTTTIHWKLMDRMMLDHLMMED